MFIDEGDVFAEIREFVDYIKKHWSLEIIIIKNDDVCSQVKDIGASIQVSSLNKQNQEALEEMNFSEMEFSFIPDSTICNHLLKTIPMRNFIADYEIKALITAIRWDEAEARESEEYFSERNHPSHFRVHPILHFKERDIWIAIFKYDLPLTAFTSWDIALWGLVAPPSSPQIFRPGCRIWRIRRNVEGGARKKKQSWTS